MTRWEQARDIVRDSARTSPHPGAALANDAREAARRLIEAFHLRRIVECGPGESTVVLAPFAGEAYHAIEHDAAYARDLDRRLVAAGVRDRVTMHLCPIVWRRVGPFVGRTYDLEDLDGLFDFGLIDGPPSRTVGRLLTLPSLWPHLERGALVLVDDAGRIGHEGRALRAWAGAYGDAVRIEIFGEYLKGLALVEKRDDVRSGRVWPGVRASTAELVLTTRSRLRRRLRRLWQR